VRQLRRRVWFRRLVLSRHAEVVLPSRTLFRLARDVWRLPAERLSYVPNGINLSDYDKPSDLAAQEARSTWDLPADKVVIGTLATLRTEKNLARLVDAFGALDQRAACHLVIAGAGPELEGLQAHVAAAGLSDYVTFPGFVEQPHKILPAFDIFALSSDTEQMPLSVLEAMAAGLPVASTDVGDIADMVAPAGRQYVAGQSCQSLLQSLNTLVQNRQIRVELGTANRNLTIDEYNIEKMLASYRELFIHG
jgi:glycosyltransferase involved in cell wall biosynthesis